MKDAEKNMFQYGIVLLNMTVNNEQVWKNKAPNSPESLRPICQIRGKESDENICT